jgi:hypothetical protein
VEDQGCNAGKTPQRKGSDMCTSPSAVLCTNAARRKPLLCSSRRDLRASSRSAK